MAFPLTGLGDQHFARLNSPGIFIPCLPHRILVSQGARPPQGLAPTEDAPNLLLTRQPPWSLAHRSYVTTLASHNLTFYIWYSQSLSPLTYQTTALPPLSLDTSVLPHFRPTWGCNPWDFNPRELGNHGAKPHPDLHFLGTFPGFSTKLPPYQACHP